MKLFKNLIFLSWIYFLYFLILNFFIANIYRKIEFLLLRKNFFFQEEKPDLVYCG